MKEPVTTTDARGVDAPVGPRRTAEAGHALLMVLVMAVVMLIGTTVAMRVWSTVIQRDREDELIFRGKQYAMGLYLYKKNVGQLPTDLKQLDEKGVGGKYYLRRQYKDPITGQDFGIINQGPNNTPIPDEPVDDPNLDGDGTATTTNGQVAVPVTGAAAVNPFGNQNQSAFGAPSGGNGLPIMGVHSKSKALAIGPAKYRDLEKYNQWFFLVTDLTGQGQGVVPVAPPPGGGLGGNPTRGPIGGSDRNGGGQAGGVTPK